MDTDDAAPFRVPETAHDPAPEDGTAAAAPPGPASPQPAPIIRYSRVPWRRVGLFILLSYGVFALIAAPFWFLPDGIAHPAYTWVIAVGMWAPAIASLILA